MGQRQQELTVVPPLVGLTVAAAHDAALDARLLAVDQDPSHSPTMPGIVAAQDPVADSEVSSGHRVRIWVDTNPDDNGGGGGPLVPSGPTLLTPAGTK